MRHSLDLALGFQDCHSHIQTLRRLVSRDGLLLPNLDGGQRLPVNMPSRLSPRNKHVSASIFASSLEAEVNDQSLSVCIIFSSNVVVRSAKETS